MGRDAELERFETLLRAAAAGRSAVQVPRGESGVGKTTLLNELSERAAKFTVLRAQGLEAEADLPFAGLATLLSPIVRFSARFLRRRRRRSKWRWALARRLPATPSRSQRAR